MMNENEYTKHYYIEGERVCSKLGGGFGIVNAPNKNPLKGINGEVADIKDDLWVMVNRGVKCTEYNPSYIKMEPDLPPAANLENKTENNLYYYHSDHLGSSSFITNIDGAAIQHLQYLPFGETYVDQKHDGPFNAIYRFSGKEKDDETQYSYFGARYYDSDLSVWINPDPLSDKYPSTSTYMYCVGNPVILKDVDGRDIWIIDPDGGAPVLYVPNKTTNQSNISSYVRTTSTALDYLTNNGLDNMGVVSTLASDPDHSVSINKVDWDTHINDVKGKIEWSPEGGLVTDNGKRQSPVIGLLHELGEAFFDYYQPTELSKQMPNYSDYSFDKVEEFRKAYDIWLSKCKKEAGKYQTIGDKWVITKVENYAAAKKGDAKRQSHHYKEKFRAIDFKSIENMDENGNK